MGGPVHAKLARHLRSQPTATERKLWAWLRTLRNTQGLHFRRQAPIGRFVADFACHAAKLIIELDGPFHDPAADADRDAWFSAGGYRTLRFSNAEVVAHWDRVVWAVEAALGLGAALDGPLAHFQPPIPASPR